MTVGRFGASNTFSLLAYRRKACIHRLCASWGMDREVIAPNRNPNNRNRCSSHLSLPGTFRLVFVASQLVVERGSLSRANVMLRIHAGRACSCAQVLV